MNRATYHLFSIAFLVLTTGCGGGNAQPQVAPQKSRADEQLTQKLADLEKQVSQLQTDLFMASLKGPQEMVWFDPQDDKAYQSVNGPAGPILVILEKVEPYLDGFTVQMRLGNPTSAGYTGLSATAKWGRKYDPRKDSEHNKVDDKKVELKDFLAPGSWTSVKFNIAPATADQVRRIGFAPVFNTIQLRNATSG